MENLHGNAPLPASLEQFQFYQGLLGGCESSRPRRKQAGKPRFSREAQARMVRFFQKRTENALKAVGRVNAGDVMLFGDKCLVVIFKGFATPYRYTRIGRIHNAALLARVCGDGRIAAAFSKQ